METEDGKCKKKNTEKKRATRWFQAELGRTRIVVVVGTNMDKKNGVIWKKGGGGED